MTAASRRNDKIEASMDVYERHDEKEKMRHPRSGPVANVLFLTYTPCTLGEPQSSNVVPRRPVSAELNCPIIKLSICLRKIFTSIAVYKQQSPTRTSISRAAIASELRRTDQ